MKTKIISLLAVVALVVAMAVPVFASSFVKVEHREQLLDLTVNTVSINWSTVTANGETKTGDSIQLTKSSGRYILGFVTSGSQRWYIQYDSSGVVSNNLYPDYVSSLQLDANDEDFDWLTNKWFTALVCDGSTCPATDVNQDNICDDCGMTFAVPRVYGPPDAYTVWTEERQVTYPYALIYTNGSGAHYLILSKSPATYEDGAIVFREVNHVIYTVFDGSWRLHQSYDEAYTSYGNIEAVYPSYNMRDASGNIAVAYNGDFFPLPLWHQMEMVTQGEMGQLTQTTVGAMATLALCGVGLLALLMGLYLFSKRSILFPRG